MRNAAVHDGTGNVGVHESLLSFGREGGSATMAWKSVGHAGVYLLVAAQGANRRSSADSGGEGTRTKRKSPVRGANHNGSDPPASRRATRTRAESRDNCVHFEVPRPAFVAAAPVWEAAAGRQRHVRAPA